MKIRIRVIDPHIEDCHALRNAKEDRWNTPWYFPNGFRLVPGVVRRDKLGRRTRGRGEQWLVFKCNTCDDCDATMLVSLEDIFSSVGFGKEQP